MVDVWRKQASSEEWVEALCDLVLKWKPLGWAEETGQIKSGVGPFLEREMNARRAYCAREQFRLAATGSARAELSRLDRDARSADTRPRAVASRVRERTA
jgi:hypothetical protein